MFWWQRFNNILVVEPLRDAFVVLRLGSTFFPVQLLGILLPSMPRELEIWILSLSSSLPNFCMKVFSSWKLGTTQSLYEHQQSFFLGCFLCLTLWSVGIDRATGFHKPRKLSRKLVLSSNVPTRCWGLPFGSGSQVLIVYQSIRSSWVDTGLRVCISFCMRVVMQIVTSGDSFWLFLGRFLWIRWRGARWHVKSEAIQL